MVFSSIIFIFTFLPITLILYYISPRRIKNITLLMASLIFYAWGEPKYIFLMVLTIIFDYFAALLISKNLSNRKKSRWIFIFTIIMNIAILGFFKYFGFIVENINSLFSTHIEYESLPLPVGISFYTFQTLSYIVDVYIRKVNVQKNFINFSLYISMFPQLVAGPIVQYSDINKQLENRNENLDKFGEGVERFIEGLGKKVLLANNIGMVWTAISSMDIANVSVISSWIGIAAYTFQIYFDFSGYSDMAIGLGKMFGFDFIENFNYPYISKSVTEFWRRWHISLGSWFRDYIYIPLGGNRIGISKQCRNIFVVWLLTGLWHGASWNFIAWGLYYGFFVLIEKIFMKNLLEKLPVAIRRIYTMMIVMVGWVLFSMNTLDESIQYIKVMFGLSGNKFIDGTSVYYLYTNILIFIILILCSTPIIKKIFNRIKEVYNSKGVIVALLIQMIILLISVAYLVNATYNPFLYFRF